MIERLIENWLTNASERSFQIPFCYMLANEGYTVLHLTRHCGMEHGKDVIAKDKEGNYCAFQLKGASSGKITLRQWQKELVGQVHQLVSSPLTHPSVPISSRHHKSFFVTNGEIHEEVSSAIDNENKTWIARGRPEYHLHTIVKGELIERAKKLGLNFIPSDLADFKVLLEFFLEDGAFVLDKQKFSNLLESFFLKETKATERAHLIRGSALLTALATSSYSNKQNHVALVEAWILFISYLLRYCEKNRIEKRYWENEFNIAKQLVYTSLENLSKEATAAENFMVGRSYEDAFIYNARVTIVIGMLSCLSLYYKLNDSGAESKDISDILNFCKKNETKLDLWGESAIPYLLAYYWFYSTVDATEKPTLILSKLIRSICSNAIKSETIFPEPYYGVDQSLALRWEKDMGKINRQNQKGSSYSLEGITHLFVRENYKQQMQALWPEISKVHFKSFDYEEITDFYKWRNRNGKEVTMTPNPKQSWKQLKETSWESKGESLPDLLKDYAYLLPLFLTVLPHRTNASILRWFQSYLDQHL
jgi:hypothetical protein